MKFKLPLKSAIIQPILTVVLIGLLIVLAIQFFRSNKDSSDTETTTRQVSREITFTTAAEAFKSKSYEVYTQGTLYLKETVQVQSTPTPGQNQPTKQTNVNVIGNPYTGLFFYTKQGTVKKLTDTTNGNNESVFYNEKGEIVTLSNKNKSYSIYPLPADEDNAEQNAAKRFFVVQDQIFNTTLPLTSLINDFENKRFNPIERSTNLYSGDWQNAFFTNGEVRNVIIETDPISGVFKSFTIVPGDGSPLSQINFDFRELPADIALYSIPADFKKVDLKLKYKAR